MERTMFSLPEFALWEKTDKNPAVKVISSQRKYGVYKECSPPQCNEIKAKVNNIYQ